MAISMLTPRQAQERAAKFCDSHCRAWAAEVFIAATNADQSATQGAGEPCGHVSLSLPLHPPTENKVLQDPRAARAWVQSWQKHPLQHYLCWTKRFWPSVGEQSVPEKVKLAGIEAITTFANRVGPWKILLERTLVLADRWCADWRKICPARDQEALGATLQKAAASYRTLEESDWQLLLLALDWLLKHPDVSCYARQLPIRGIDTKWIERHKGAISQLQCAFSGKANVHILLKAPPQCHVRFLDEQLAPCGLRDVSIAPAEFSHYTGKPRAVIICENLVSTMTLPPLAGVITIHGGGYGVSELASITWLAHTPILYWGDIDTHGFAILNQWRHHNRHTASLMMDRETLAAHRDLCVVEPTPNKGSFDHLTEEEQATLQQLTADPATLRLEQERIEWNYALQHIEAALATIA
ncbi:MAG: DUF2220 family protein [Raoultibacter sp.]